MPMHIIVLGQSNVASHGKDELVTTRHGRVWYDGRFAELGDPVAGGTGAGASIWPRVADRLAADGWTDGIVVSMKAVGGTGSDDWSTGGKCFAALMRDASAIDACPTPVTHIVFHQGERDTLLGTDHDTYVDRIATLIDATHAKWHAAPWLMCRASYRMGVVNEAVIAAQDSLIARYDFCHPGPNTDALGALFRHDDTHFNSDGLARFAADLAVAIASV